MQPEKIASIIALSLAIVASIKSPTKAESLTAVNGIIRYPSDWIPPLTICAVNVITWEKTVCIQSVAEQQTFRMLLPPGQYYFSAEDSRRHGTTPVG